MKEICRSKRSIYLQPENRNKVTAFIKKAVVGITIDYLYNIFDH